MADIQVPVDLGFTEFVTSLLSEVLRSVVAAQADQDERLRELLEVAELSPDEYAARHLTDQAVDDWLTQVLPSTGDGRAHDAVRGTPYTKATATTPEQPPYAEVLGVELASGTVSAETGRLLAAGERQLRTAARTRLAEREVTVARSLAARGLPRVVVDAGRVTAKLTFEALRYGAADDAEDASADAGDRGDAPITRALRRKPTVMAGRLPQLRAAVVVPEVLRDVRLKVHTADQRETAASTGRTNVYGEVELTFKTVH